MILRKSNIVCSSKFYRGLHEIDFFSISDAGVQPSGYRYVIRNFQKVEL